MDKAHRTVVYQSFRPTSVPAWMRACMESVRRWAEARGFVYELHGDEMLELVPSWYRQRASGVPRGVLLVTDLGRLLLAREYVRKGYGRIIWVDADVLVFDPDAFDLPSPAHYAFCQEVWTGRAGPVRAVRDLLRAMAGGSQAPRYGVNNAVCVFTDAATTLDFLIQSAIDVVRFSGPELSSIDVGTRFLSALHSHLRFPLITSVGLFSPWVLHDIAAERQRYARRYMSGFGHPIQAANLCLTSRGGRFGRLAITDDVYERVVRRLVDTKGRAMNDLVRRQPRPR